MIASQIFSSVGIGLLIGILLGLSASPVAGLVLASVTALLASLIVAKTPIKPGEQSAAERISQYQLELIGVRAGVFGLICVVGIFIGIYMRTHNVLTPPEPTLKQRVKELTDIGFSAKEAREVVVTRITNTEFSAKKINEKPTASINALNKTILFAIDSEICEKIDVRRFKNITSVIEYYQAIKLNSLVKIATSIDQHVNDEKAKMDIMGSILEVLCEKE